MTDLPAAAPLRIAINLDRNEVGAAAVQAASEVSAIFGIARLALADADLANLPEAPNEQVNFRMKLTGRSQEEERHAYERRLVAMCVNDLARGIRVTMEEAAVYLGFLSTPLQSLSGTTEAEVRQKAAARINGLRKEMQGMTYPPLLERVQAGLLKPLTWAPELASFQKVRNCLEHRGGVVGERDVDETGQLSLSLPSLELYHLDSAGNETPLQFGVPNGTDTTLNVRSFTKTRTFQLGEAVDVPPSQIHEIAFSVWMLAADMIERLPAPTGDIPLPQ